MSQADKQSAVQAVETIGGVASPRGGAALVGTWRLVSWEAAADDGTVEQPFGSEAIGWLVYTGDGHMFAQLMRPGRPAFASGDMLRPAPEEAQQAVGGYIAYGGTFDVRDDETIVHHVALSLAPSWVGADQERRYQVTGGRLTLTSPPILVAGAPTIHRLTWERVHGPAPAG